VLPPDLRRAETDALEALRRALADNGGGRWTLQLRFEGLRLLPVALRLLAALAAEGRPVRLLFPDAGAAALARRDAPELAERLSSLGDRLRSLEAAANGEPGPEGADELLIAVAPAQPEYGEVERLCQGHRGGVVMLNGNLEDAAVGIGSVARQRRSGFLATWRSAYALIPLDAGALRHAFPDPWQLYRRDPDGYRAVAEFDPRPDAEQIAEALAPGQGSSLAGGLQALDRFLGSLRS
jgi:hypothetical protein